MEFEQNRPTKHLLLRRKVLLPLRHLEAKKSMEIEYQELRNGGISPQDYIVIAEVTSSQITSQISEFVTSKPPEAWQDSYISYMNAMQKFNSYIGETKVLANLIEKGSTDAEINEVIERIESIKKESLEHVRNSEEQRPK